APPSAHRPSANCPSQWPSPSSVDSPPKINPAPSNRPCHGPFPTAIASAPRRAHGSTAPPVQRRERTNATRRKKPQLGGERTAGWIRPIANFPLSSTLACLQSCVCRHNIEECHRWAPSSSRSRVGVAALLIQDLVSTRIRHLTAVHFNASNSQVSNTGLKHLNDLQNLRWLSLTISSSPQRR
ncbi:unnamed protein product, partial [Urochloa humidicola]